MNTEKSILEEKIPLLSLNNMEQSLTAKYNGIKEQLETSSPDEVNAIEKEYENIYGFSIYEGMNILKDEIDNVRNMRKELKNRMFTKKKGKRRLVERKGG